MDGLLLILRDLNDKGMVVMLDVLIEEVILFGYFLLILFIMVVMILYEKKINK